MMPLWIKLNYNRSVKKRKFLKNKDFKILIIEFLISKNLYNKNNKNNKKMKISSMINLRFLKMKKKNIQKTKNYLI